MTSERNTGPNSVYERACRPARRLGLAVLASLWCMGSVVPAQAQAPRQAPGGDGNIVEAREALKKKDRARLAAARDTALAEKHPLAMWADYFELGNRLADATPEEVEAFMARWRGTYVEDRLRNDWLLELGKRRDWANFAAEFPRFRMNDDREVTCYALMLDHQFGKPVRDAALAAWVAQRDADDGCALMAATLFDAKVFGTAEVWRKARAAVEANRARAVQQATMMVSLATAGSAAELMDKPLRYLAGRDTGSGRLAGGRIEAELAALALTRLAATDPQAAAQLLNDRFDRALPADLASWSWAAVAKQSAVRLLPEAPDHYQRAALRPGRGVEAIELPDETLAWKVRAALRADNGRARWQQVMQGINAMSAEEQRDPAWVYWKARALQALAGHSQDGDSMRTLAQELLSGIADQFHFYGKLAADNLGRTLSLPPPPAPLTAEERAGAAGHPGLARALQLIALGLRSEGVREWNFSLRGMAERELLAAAQLACDREVWDRCINTSDRTRNEIHMAQRFPTPFRREVSAAAREIGLDPAYVYGLIRQESRFILDARSTAGASGLMQLMPATARWTARKIGLDYSASLITDRDTNLKLGTTYLKLVLDDFDGSQAMAAAAYNAGPGRPRRWREGPTVETAIWAENIPFNETRDYVKKVLSNATYYAAMMNGQVPSLKSRLGAHIGPREIAAPPPDKSLP